MKAAMQGAEQETQPPRQGANAPPSAATDADAAAETERGKGQREEKEAEDAAEQKHGYTGILGLDLVRVPGIPSRSKRLHNQVNLLRFTRQSESHQKVTHRSVERRARPIKGIDKRLEDLPVEITGDFPEVLAEHFLVNAWAGATELRNLHRIILPSEYT